MQEDQDMMPEEVKEEKVVVQVIQAPVVATFASAVNNPEGISGEDLVLLLKDPKQYQLLSQDYFTEIKFQDGPVLDHLFPSSNLL